MTTRLISPTLIICLGAALAAGIALARPANVAPTTPEAEVAATTVTTTTPDSNPASKADTGIARTEPIEIESFAYNAITVPGGAVVEVRNLDGAPHTVTAADGGFATPQIAGPGAATFVAPDVPGTYAYFCAIHPSMQGSLVVT